MRTPVMTYEANTAVRLSVITLLSISAALIGCSGSSGPAGMSASGGAQASGSLSAGASALGGTLTQSTGGTRNSTAAGGGSSAIPITGGSTSETSLATGGVHPAGGSDTASSSAGTISGGMPASGGTKSSGGTRATGGAATGGTSAAKTTSGGATSSVATGGSKNTGGTKSTGSAVTGGVSGSGGTGAASGGVSTSGGTSSNASSPVTIWMAGDSTMMNCSNSVCPCGWGSELAGYFNKNVTVTNRAVGGRSVQTWLYEAAVTDTLSNGDCVLSSSTYDSRWTSMLNLMKPGDYLMIAFGINDGDTKCPRHVSSTRFQSLLDVMVKAAQDKGATPILLTPTDAIECSGTTVLQKRGFLTETKAVASADAVPLIDLNQLSMTLYASLGFCPNDGNYTSTTSTLGKFFCEDHTHFEAAGAKQIAGLVVDALRTQNIGLAAYLN